MRAIVYRDYGGPEVLRLEVLPPPAPREGELLIRVRAASINPMDSHFMHRPLVMRLGSGLRRPRKPERPGVDLAGVVEATGPGVTRFRAGGAVFGGARGALAALVIAAEDKLAAKPDPVSFEDA